MFYLRKLKLYRKLKGGVWYKHKNTWARYGELNRFTKVIKIENYAAEKE